MKTNQPKWALLLSVSLASLALASSHREAP